MPLFRFLPAMAVVCLAGLAALADAHTVVFQDAGDAPVVGTYVTASPPRVMPGEGKNSTGQPHPSAMKPSAVKPSGAPPILCLDRPQASAKIAYVARFVRPVLAGEQLRLELNARLDAGGDLQFGLADDDGKPAVLLSLRSDGTIACRCGERDRVIAGLPRAPLLHTPGTWQHYRIEYAVGSDRLLVIVAGKRLAAVSGPFVAGKPSLTQVNALFLAAGDASTVGYLSDLTAMVDRDPAIDALPAFGRIDWQLEEIPFIAPGPAGGISGAAMAASGGGVYLAGGFIPGGDETADPDRRTSRWAHRYDPQARQWTRLPDLPARREYTRGIAAGGDLFVLGGAKQQPYAPFGDVFKLRSGDPDTQGWTRMPAMNVPRTHAAIGYAAHRLIVAGGNQYDLSERGYSPRTVRNTTEVLDLRSPERGWQAAVPIPGLPRGWSASAVAGEKLYVFGGVTWVQDGGGARKRWTPETLCYDPATDAWSQRTPPPVAGSGWHAATYKDRYIILVGGLRNVDAKTGRYEWNTDPIVYDVRDDRWLKVEYAATIPGGVYNDPGVAIVGDRIFVVGGEGTASHFNYLLAGEIRPASDPGTK